MVLNGELSSWCNIETGIPEDSVLGLLLLLMYINDLSDGLITNARLFGEEVLLFCVVNNINFSATNNELAK